MNHTTQPQRCRLCGRPASEVLYLRVCRMTMYSALLCHVHACQTLACDWGLSVERLIVGEADSGVR